MLAPQYQGCCSLGCKTEAVNVKTKNKEEEARNKQCGTKDYICPAYKCPLVSYTNSPFCEQNRCVVKEKPINGNQSNLENYKIIGSFTSPGESFFVKTLGSVAYLTDISEGLLAIDVSNPKEPKLLSKTKIGGGGAYALAKSSGILSSTYLLVSGYGNAKMSKVNIANSQLKIIGNIDAKRSIQDMVMVDNIGYLAIDGPEIERIVIIPAPNSASEDTAVQNPKILPFSKNLNENLPLNKPLKIFNNLTFWQNCNILNSCASEEIIKLPENSHAISMAISNMVNASLDNPHYILVIAQGETGIGIYDVDSRKNLTKLITNISDIDYVSAVAINGNHIYAGTSDEVKIIDLTTQKVVSKIPAKAWRLKVKDNLLYIAEGEKGVTIVDVSDPTKPRTITTIDTPGRARDMAIDGDYIYVADDRDDLQIIQKF